MKPQTLGYKKGGNITLLENSKTLLIHYSDLQWGKLYPPTIIINGLEKDRTKFDFYKAYKNTDDVVCHCEYRSIKGEEFKLIVHTL